MKYPEGKWSEVFADKCVMPFQANDENLSMKEYNKKYEGHQPYVSPSYDIAVSGGHGYFFGFRSVMKALGDHQDKSNVVIDHSDYYPVFACLEDRFNGIKRRSFQWH